MEVLSRTAPFSTLALNVFTLRVPVKMLGPLLLCSREGSWSQGSGAFEIKVDNIRFAGYPFAIENTAHSLQLAVVFV